MSKPPALNAENEKTDYERPISGSNWLEGLFRSLHDALERKEGVLKRIHPMVERLSDILYETELETDDHMTEYCEILMDVRSELRTILNINVEEENKMSESENEG